MSMMTDKPKSPTAPYAFVYELDGTTNVVHVYGELDLATASELEETIAQAAKLGGPVTVDLEPCNYIDSSVLTVLVRAHKTLGERLGIRLPKSGSVRRLFEVTSLLLALPVVEA